MFVYEWNFLFFFTWVILAFYSYLITIGGIKQRMYRVVGINIGEIHMHSCNDSI